MTLTIAESAEQIGLNIAYEHLIPFLNDRGTSCDLKEIYAHLLTVGVKADLIPVQYLHNSAWVRQFRKGVLRVKPQAWSSVQVRQYGQPLPLMTGSPLPRGHWAINPKFYWTAETRYKEKEEAKSSNAAYDHLFNQFAAMQLTSREVLRGKSRNPFVKIMQWLRRSN